MKSDCLPGSMETRNLKKDLKLGPYLSILHDTVRRHGFV
jgi:hypothetical protein